MILVQRIAEEEEAMLGNEQRAAPRPESFERRRPVIGCACSRRLRIAAGACATRAIGIGHAAQVETTLASGAENRHDLQRPLHRPESPHKGLEKLLGEESLR